MSAANAVKVACKLCKREEHILVDHITKKHDMDPVAYMDKFPGAPLWSSYGLAKIKEAHQSSAVIATARRPRKKVAMKKLFPEFGKRKGYELTGDYEVFDTPGPLTPARDPYFVFPEDITLDFLSVIDKNARNRVYIQGPPGTGKTTFAFQVAATIGAEVLEWNADAFMQRSMLVGHYKVIGGETVWVDGVLPRAMRFGYWLLVNEIDMLDPHTMNVLKPVLEDPPRLTIMEHEGEVIHAHPDFRVIAMANTWGRGDSTGMFVNAHTHSMADTNRWSIKLRMNYLDKEDEVQLLRTYFPDKLGDEEKEENPKDSPEKFVSVATKVREACKAGTIDYTLSARELVNWAENYLVLGKGIHHAARLSFLDALEPDVAHAIQEHINAVFGQEAP